MEVSQDDFSLEWQNPRSYAPGHFKSRCDEHTMPSRKMKTIPSETIDEIWGRISESTPDEVKTLFEGMQREQPALAAYLTFGDEDIMESEEKGSLLFLGLIIWEILSNRRATLNEVTSAELEAAEDANFEFLEGLAEDSEISYTKAVTKMVVGYNQMPLLGAVVEALMEDYQETPELAGDNVGLALLHLKTVIDCLDQ